MADTPDNSQTTEVAASEFVFYMNKASGGIAISTSPSHDPNYRVIAHFERNLSGMLAFTIFKEGLAAIKGSTLYDETEARFEIGTLDQLLK